MKSRPFSYFTWPCQAHKVPWWCSRAAKSCNNPTHWLAIRSLYWAGAYKLYHNVIKPYFEKYEDHIDDGINKVTSDAQAVAVKNLQGIAWHLIMKSDKYVLDILSNAVKYVLNFDPGVSTGKNANTGTTSINVVPDNECDLAADGKDPNLGQMSNISRGCIAAAQTETARAESNEKKEDVKSLVLVWAEHGCEYCCC